MYCVCVFQSGQEFHADLYPDTLGRTAAMEAEEWWRGGNKLVLPPPSKTACTLHTCTAHLHRTPAPHCGMNVYGTGCSMYIQSGGGPALSFSGPALSFSGPALSCIVLSSQAHATGVATALVRIPFLPVSPILGFELGSSDS